MLTYRFQAPRLLESAWKAYMNGDIGPWDFQEVVEEFGFVGWTGTKDGEVILHSAR